MKHLLPLMTAIAMILSFSGCKENVDLKNIDPHADVQMGIALPVGNMTATMGDFLGGGRVKKIYVQTEATSQLPIFHFIDTVDIPRRSFHVINLKDYIIKDSTTMYFDLASQFPSIPDGVSIPSGTTQTLRFPVVLKVTGVNDNTTRERLDSMLISRSEFISVINTQDFDLKESEIESVTLVMGDQFNSRGSSKEKDLPVSGYRFGDSLRINVNDYTVSLMKDKNDFTHFVDTIAFDIVFKIKTNHSIPLHSTSQLAYNMRINLLEFDALWGYFEPNNQLDDENRLNMDSLWDEWANVKKLKVRFQQPRIDVYVDHHVSAPLRMLIKYIRVMNSDGVEVSASWSGETSHMIYFNHQGETLSPREDQQAIGDSVTLHEYFDNDSDHGNIDHLFDARPDIFSYCYDLQIDPDRWPNKGNYPYNQMRITKDSMIVGYARIDAPFIFNEGSEAEYKTTFDDINISKISFDSIISDNDMIDTLIAHDVLVFMNVQNSIPFDIDARFTFRDQDSSELDVKLINNNDNHIIFRAPTADQFAPASATEKGVFYKVVAPSDTTLIVRMDQDEYNRFCKTKYINLDASLVNNPVNCEMDSTTKMTVHLGVAADVEAIINWKKESNK